MMTINNTGFQVVYFLPVVLWCTNLNFLQRIMQHSKVLLPISPVKRLRPMT